MDRQYVTMNLNLTNAVYDDPANSITVLFLKVPIFVRGFSAEKKNNGMLLGDNRNPLRSYNYSTCTREGRRFNISY